MFLNEAGVKPEIIAKVRKLNAIANERGETMAQLALAWVLENPAITSVITGASKPEQIIQNVKTIEKHVPLSDEEKQLIADYLKYMEYLATWDGKLPEVVTNGTVLLPTP